MLERVLESPKGQLFIGDRPVTVVTAKLADAQFAMCQTCGPLPTNQLWSVSKTRGLHQGGTGHKVDLARVKRSA